MADLAAARFFRPVFERARQMREQLRQPVGVLDELRRDVVAVVIVTERRVVA